MRYTPAQLEAIKTHRLLHKPVTDLKFDPITYSMDLFFIDDWLMKHFYPECDDLQNDMHWRSRMDFAAVLLSHYYGSDWCTVESSLSHWDCLARYLYEHGFDCMDSNDPASLVSVLAGM